MQQSCKERKKYITLIEIMIVMFLIALIAGVVAYNYRGSLDEGRAFQTKQNIEKIRNILELELAKERVINWGNLDKAKLESYIEKSPLVKDKTTLLSDGWGTPLEITVDSAAQKFTIRSTAKFCEDNPEKCGQPKQG